MEWFGTTQYREESTQKEIKERFRNMWRGLVWWKTRGTTKEKNAKKYVYFFFWGNK